MPVGRENALLFFFALSLCASPYLEQRPVELRRGPSGAGREGLLKRLRNPTQQRTMGCLFPWKLVRAYPQSRYLDTMPRENANKKEGHFVGWPPFHGIIVGSVWSVQ